MNDEQPAINRFDLLHQEITAHGQAASRALTKLRTRVETLETREQQDRVWIAYLAVALITTLVFAIVCLGVAINASFQ